MKTNKNTKRSTKSNQWIGASLCISHAVSHGLEAGEYSLVPHHSAQADDEEIACDCCTVAVMRAQGAL